MARGDARFLQSLQGAAIAPLMYLGAKHMITGYDHLLFLVGVIFFLYRPRDVVRYVTLFTLGHSVTLLAGVLLGVHANAFLVDAVIGFSVVYKAFDNMDGFKRFLGYQPDTQHRGSGVRAVPRVRTRDQASGFLAAPARAGRPISSASMSASKSGRCSR